MLPENVPLSRMEKMSLALGELLNEREPLKRLQTAYLKGFGHGWVSRCIKNLLHVVGGEHVPRDPDRGVMLCANHRSFFDQYVIMTVFVERAPWVNRMFFPVRSNFFYEGGAGMFVNLLMGGGCMYPPIFRDPSKSELNKLAIDTVIDLLGQRGTIIGMHPEGTRGKGPDPYELLPAQPGVGQVIMKAKPIVVPIFINGLGNDIVQQIASNFLDGGRRGTPIIVQFGPPVDLGALLAGNPRPAQYKRVADRVLEEIRKLGERERELRASLPREA
jgi:1-acyl-sn-glycerol-3-phosphate acyltransferase